MDRETETGTARQPAMAERQTERQIKDIYVYAFVCLYIYIYNI